MIYIAFCGEQLHRHQATGDLTLIDVINTQANQTRNSKTHDVHHHHYYFLVQSSMDFCINCTGFASICSIFSFLDAHWVIIATACVIVCADDTWTNEKKKKNASSNAHTEEPLIRIDLEMYTSWFCTSMHRWGTLRNTHTHSKDDYKPVRACALVAQPKIRCYYNFIACICHGVSAPFLCLYFCFNCVIRSVPCTDNATRPSSFWYPDKDHNRMLSIYLTTATRTFGDVSQNRSGRIHCM